MSAVLIPAIMAVLAAAPAQDRAYGIGNPTPRSEMRPLSTDRPDTTESPYTVDAGHFQIEASAVAFATDETGGVRSRVTEFAPVNLKVGLSDAVDLQFVFTPRARFETGAEGRETVETGFGDDTQIRLKVNLWGNDGGGTAFAIMPFIKLPTGPEPFNTGKLEGGLILPLAVALPGDTSLGLMAEVDAVRDADGGYALDFVHTATLGHALVGDLSGYVEYVGVAPGGDAQPYRASASGGLTLRLTDDMVIDAGGTVGLTDSADDLTVFVGLSRRF